jgi:hypothetical protein
VTVRRVPGPISRIPAVPPVLKRGGKTFTQQAAVSGGRVVVTRKSTGSATANSPYSHGGNASGHHGGHHGGHHHTTTVRHYHYHYWGPGWGWYYCYTPYWSYDPWFWGWYWGPFAAPWHYRWWWVGDSWYRTWGWYYSPYVVYVGPSYWVTDYTLARMLEDEYARGWAAGRASTEAEVAGAAISEPVKEQIRVQVDAVARTFQESGSLTLQKALEDPDYLFIVDTSLSLVTDQGETCALSGGDVIRRVPEDEPGRPVASMTVVTTKGGECRAGSQVSVSYADLQEMLNTFGQTVDDGLKELQRQQQEEADGDR